MKRETGWLARKQQLGYEVTLSQTMEGLEHGIKESGFYVVKTEKSL